MQEAETMYVAVLTERHAEGWVVHEGWERLACRRRETVLAALSHQYVAPVEAWVVIAVSRLAKEVTAAFSAAKDATGWKVMAQVDEGAIMKAANEASLCAASVWEGEWDGMEIYHVS